MSRLLSVPPSPGVKGKNNGYSCEACGRVFENPIRLTNLSALPMETYNACPFCFSKLDEVEGPDEVNRLETSVSISPNNPTLPEENSEKAKPPPGVECPHYFGYLKKRPKNTPFPDRCLTCEKMMDCLL
jgi:hypothetical protein